MGLVFVILLAIIAVSVLVVALAAAAARGDRQPSTVFWLAPERSVPPARGPAAR